MDLTPTLSGLLAQTHSSKPIPTASARTQLIDTLDSFLREAYQINNSLTSLLTYLRSIRQPYLSTAPPPRRTGATSTKSTASLTSADDIPTHLTDAQRAEIDRSTSELLRDLNNSITSLSQAADLQHSTATQLLQRKYGKPSSFLFRWAAGSDDTDGDALANTTGKSARQLEEEGKAKTQKEWRDGVCWYLRMKLEVAAGKQGGMVDKRVERERERQMSRLSDVRNKGVRSWSFGSRDLGSGEGSLGGGRGVEGGDGGRGGRSNGEAGPVTGNVTGTGSERYGNIDLRGHDAYDPALDPSSATTTTTTTSNTNTSNTAINTTTNTSSLQNLSPTQLQLFETENAALLTHLTTHLSKITAAEKSLLEISSLQQTLLGHLTTQGEQIGNLADNAAGTGEDLARGNKELKRAGERAGMAKGVFWGTVGLCGWLLVWDLIF